MAALTAAACLPRATPRPIPAQLGVPRSRPPPSECCGGSRRERRWCPSLSPGGARRRPRGSPLCWPPPRRARGSSWPSTEGGTRSPPSASPPVPSPSPCRAMSRVLQVNPQLSASCQAWCWGQSRASSSPRPGGLRGACPPSCGLRRMALGDALAFLALVLHGPCLSPGCGTVLAVLCSSRGAFGLSGAGGMWCWEGRMGQLGWGEDFVWFQEGGMQQSKGRAFTPCPGAAALPPVPAAAPSSGLCSQVSPGLWGERQLPAAPGRLLSSRGGC